MDIMDFVINEEELDAGKKTKKKSASSKPTYSIEAVSGCDVVISKSGRKPQSLALLISQDQFYIKRDEEILILTYDLLKNFFKELSAKDTLSFPDCAMLPELNKTDLHMIWQCISGDDVFKSMAKKGLVTYPEAIKDVPINNDKLSYSKKRSLFEISPNFLKWTIDHIPVKDINRLGWQSTEALKTLYEESPDKAKFLMLKLAKSSMMSFGFNYKCLQMINKYNLDFCTFIEYLLFGLYKQGRVRVESTELNLLDDYYYSEYDLYGKVKDKYPKSLATAHDISMKNKREKMDLANVDLARFNCEVQDYKRLTFSYKDYFIRPAESIDELIDEGNQLGHCVGTYGPKIAGGECMIFFLRKKAEPEKSLLTVELRGYSLYEIEGDNRRAVLNDDERKFIARWADEYKISLDSNENFSDRWAA